MLPFNAIAIKKMAEYMEVDQHRILNELGFFSMEYIKQISDVNEILWLLITCEGYDMMTRMSLWSRKQEIFFTEDEEPSKADKKTISNITKAIEAKKLFKSIVNYSTYSSLSLERSDNFQTLILLWQYWDKLCMAQLQKSKTMNQLNDLWQICPENSNSYWATLQKWENVCLKALEAATTDSELREIKYCPIAVIYGKSAKMLEDRLSNVSLDRIIKKEKDELLWQKDILEKAKNCTFINILRNDWIQSNRTKDIHNIIAMKIYEQFLKDPNIADTY